MSRTRYRNFLSDNARWDGFEFRDGDIVITTPAKCGTTWMQMICALLIFRTPELPAPLAELSPWLDMQLRPRAEVVDDLGAQMHRRFIKTHTPLDGLPDDDRVTYLHVCRDPRDVALSWDNHAAIVDLDRLWSIRLAAVGADDLTELGITEPPPPPPEDPAERFWVWVGDADTAETSDFSRLAAHVHAAWERRHEPNVHLFHYADLRADLTGQMRRLAEILDADLPTAELVDAATFDQMKLRADTLIPNSDTPIWRRESQFFDKARLGGWRELFDDEGLQRYESAARRLLPKDAWRWVHDGEQAAATGD
jgi:hypothetical protein